MSNRILLSDDSKLNIQRLLLNEVIRKHVMSAGEEGESYKAIRISDSGIVTLGKTDVWWWNRLVKCQFPLTFHQFASAVWEGLLELSTGNNKEALKKGLGIELMEHAQLEKDYDWVVKRLQECYDHVCNNKGGADLEGPRGKSGPSVAYVPTQTEQPVTINVNIDGRNRKTVLLPDATGQAFLKCELGVVDVKTVVRHD